MTQLIQGMSSSQHLRTCRRTGTSAGFSASGYQPDRRSFTCSCKIPGNLYRFSHHACEMLWAWKTVCCKKLLPKFSMEHTNSKSNRFISIFANFSMQHVKLPMNFLQFLHTLKILSRWYFIQLTDFVLSPLEGFTCNNFFSWTKNGLVGNLWANFYSKNKKCGKKPVK